MTELERSASALGVGPSRTPATPPSSTALACGSEIDGFEERCGVIVDLHLAPLMKSLTEMERHTTQTMARIAVVRLIPYMSGEETEELLKVLARRVVEGRRNESRAE